MEQYPQIRWLAWAQRIQAIAQTGLAYGKDPYDLERYTALQALAAEIMTEHTAIPLDRIALALGEEKGYPTPKVDIRAAVFNAHGEILLVREQGDGLWSLPGGWADVGESPAEVAVKEVREESGYIVRPIKLAAVLDRAKHPHPPMLWHVYKLYFLCELVGGEARQSLETDAVSFFSTMHLPPLSISRVTEAQIRRLAEHLQNPDLPTDFD